MILRISLLLLGALAFLAGIYGGLSRIGWPLPYGGSLVALHGPLLLSGVFGTLIGLERAVALGQTWAYAAPVSSTVGTLLLLADVTFPLGAGAYVLASSLLLLASAVLAIRQPALFMVILVLGACAGLVGTALWFMGTPVRDAVGWWLSFLILTIAGERLELSRLMPPRRGSTPLFLTSIGLLAAGAGIGVTLKAGAILYGAALLVMTIWLLRHDIAVRNIRQTGQTRFFATCMILGYLWLGLAGITPLVLPPDLRVWGYDLILHAILIGFVLSMVFGHALIILPAVTRRRIAYSPLLYAPLFMLHASVLVRVGGDLTDWQQAREWSGIVTALAMITFGLCLARNARRSRPAKISGKPLRGASEFHLSSGRNIG